MNAASLKILLVILLTVPTFFACGGGGGGGPASDAALILRPELVYASPNFIVGLDVAPDGRIFFTELETGSVRILRTDGLQPEPFVTLPVPARGSVLGLLGVAVDPDFEENHWVYVYVTSPNPFRNRVIRFREQDGRATEALLIIDNIPAGGHNGGKLAFDDSGHIFISTGDAGDPGLSQEILSLAGKVLRLNKDGSIPGDNPFPGSPVFSFGFRNVFGIDFDRSTGEILVSENGPDCDDEINVLTPGGNFGWRTGILCGDSDPNFIQPIYRVSPSIGFTGITFYTGDVFPELRDSLLLADFNTGLIRRLRLDRSPPRQLIGEDIIFQGAGIPILDIRESPIGEILFTSTNGIFRLQR